MPELETELIDGGKLSFNQSFLQFNPNLGVLFRGRF